MAKKKSEQETLEKEEKIEKNANENGKKNTDNASGPEENEKNNSTFGEDENNKSENETAKPEILSEEEESYKIQLQRLQAEFLNFKKRTEKEKMELSQFVKVEFMKRFLPVLDDISRLDQHKEGDDKSLKDGIELVVKKIDDFFKQEKVERFAAVGDDFDPELHEALMQQPVEDEKDDDKIISVFENGIKIADKIVRYAKVQVGKKM